MSHPFLQNTRPAMKHRSYCDPSDIRRDLTLDASRDSLPSLYLFSWLHSLSQIQIGNYSKATNGFKGKQTNSETQQVIYTRTFQTNGA